MKVCIVEPTPDILQASDLIAAAGESLLTIDRALATKALIEAGK